MKRQPWIGEKWLELLLIIAPPFACLLAIALFPQWLGEAAEMSTAGWVVLVLLIDVAHVYSTLFRTYLDPRSLPGRRQLLWMIPFICFIAGVLLYSLGSGLFWSVLAYTAVYHFIRQQYGFVRVYSRTDPAPPIFKRIDTLTIYAATIFPILYWHFKGDRKFSWFVEGDFFIRPLPQLLTALQIAYCCMLLAYLVKEVVYVRRFGMLNWPRFLVIAGTVLSWYFGIVYFNGDMAFTMLNVVSHGIPYMALIWLYGKKHYTKGKTATRFLRKVFSPSWGWLIFIALIVACAYLEEGAWDLAVWKEHGSVFGHLSFSSLPNSLLTFTVPLLILPQLTHYVLDGFIWKARQSDMKGILSDH